MNYKPNEQQNAFEFWADVVRNLVYEAGECLIIKHNNKFFIADSFIKEDSSSFSESIFKSIVINGKTIDKNYLYSDVLYFKYTNESLKKIMTNLNEDYARLFTRVLEYQFFSKQIRSTMKMKVSNRTDEDSINKLQLFMNRLTVAFKNNTLATIPISENDEYKEYSSNHASDKGIDEIDKVTKQYASHIARALHIPIQLLNGETAESTKINHSYINYCIKPLLTMICKELTAKTFNIFDLKRGDCIIFNAFNLTVNNVFDVSEKMDKFIQDGVFTINDVLEEIGRERVNDPICDKRHITKNLDSLKGGDENEQE